MTLTLDKEQKQLLKLLKAATQGYALDEFKEVITALPTAEVRARITQTQISAGELLWQGRYGFCVATKDCERTEQHNGEVLVLQEKNLSKTFTGPFLVPVAGLLEEGVLRDDELSLELRAQLKEMGEKLQAVWDEEARLKKGREFAADCCYARLGK
ncbi:hypothetical protein KAI87_06710 [Myxococcota bacterium]|nr:hypothetical protein [Myxococcota bacterium]